MSTALFGEAATPAQSNKSRLNGFSGDILHMIIKR